MRNSWEVSPAAAAAAWWNIPPPPLDNGLRATKIVGYAVSVMGSSRP
jgi:hypothetical protein